MTTEAERTNTGRWLKSARKAAGYSNARVFLAAVKAAEGSAPSYSTYAQWESGKVGGREEGLDLIRRFHSARLTPVAPIIDPMERIAAAVEDIARTLASLQTDMAGQSGATIGAVQTLGAQLTAILDRRPSA